MTDSEKKQLLSFLQENGKDFSAYNHVYMTDIGDGWAKAQLDLQPESLNVWQVPHGGALFCMADMVTGTAAITKRLESCLTVQSSMEFLKAAGSSGLITAVGKVTRCGHKLCFSEAEITDEQGTLLARASAVLSFSGKKLNFTK